MKDASTPAIDKTLNEAIAKTLFSGAGEASESVNAWFQTSEAFRGRVWADEDGVWREETEEANDRVWRLPDGFDALFAERQKLEAGDIESGVTALLDGADAIRVLDAAEPFSETVLSKARPHDEAAKELFDAVMQRQTDRIALFIGSRSSAKTLGTPAAMCFCGMVPDEVEEIYALDNAFTSARRSEALAFCVRAGIKVLAIQRDRNAEEQKGADEIAMFVAGRDYETEAGGSAFTCLCKTDALACKLDDLAASIVSTTVRSAIGALPGALVPSLANADGALHEAKATTLLDVLSLLSFGRVSQESEEYGFLGGFDAEDVWEARREKEISRSRHGFSTYLQAPRMITGPFSSLENLLKTVKWMRVGRVRVSRIGSTAPDEACFIQVPNGAVPQEALVRAGMRQAAEIVILLASLVAVWKSHLENAGVMLRLCEALTIDDVRRVAETLGTAASVSALFEGVPLEDVLGSEAERLLREATADLCHSAVSDGSFPVVQCIMRRMGWM